MSPWLISRVTAQKAFKSAVIIAIVGRTVAYSCPKPFEIIGEFAAVSGLTGE
jgi:hypothetical protein